MSLKQKQTKFEWLSSILEKMRDGDMNTFFENVDDNVLWSIETMHPSTGTNRLFRNKKEIRAIFDKANRNLKTVFKHYVKKIYHDEKQNAFTVLLQSSGISTKDLVYELPQCWILIVADNPYRIIGVTAYQDSLALAHFYNEQLQEKDF